VTAVRTLDVADDQTAIRALIDAYAHFADRRQPADQAALYAEDATTLVYNGDPATSEPVQSIQGPTAHAEAFKVLSQYLATTHFNGQSTVLVDGDCAHGETYCLAHHLSESGDGRTLLVMSIRYQDSFLRTEGGWRFSERKLIIDWTDSRMSQP
jgi:ketosteroid isomerase-like protein